MLVQRVIVAMLGIPLFLGVCLWGPVPFAIAVTILAAIGLTEMLRVYRGAVGQPAAVFGIVALAAAAWPGVGGTQAGAVIAAHAGVLAAACLLAVFVAEVARAAVTGEMATGRRLAWGLLCGSYIALFGGISDLRNDTTPVGAGVFPALQAGAARVLVAAFCVWATDSLAYFVGRAMGRRKLAPLLSPNKTVEGALGGLGGALAVGAGAGAALLGSWQVGLVVGLLAGTLGQVGDLFKSALKREAGVKDFGALMPGHGGVLDRFDSLLFVATATVLVLAVWLQ